MMEPHHNQPKVREVLSGAILTLCKSLLSFQTEITIEGLLGITVDKKNVVLVNIQELVPGPGSGFDGTGDIKDLDLGALDAAMFDKALGSCKDQDQVVNGDWNTDMDIKIPENVLAELIKEHTDKNDLFDEQPKKAKRKKSKKKNIPMNGGQPKTVTNGKETMNGGKQYSPSSEESPRGKALTNSLRYFGERDTLLSMDHDEHSLEDFPPNLSSQTNLDYSNQLSMNMSPIRKSDLFGKSVDFMSSVKEENEDVRTNFMDSADSFVDSSFLSNVLDTDLGEKSTDRYPCKQCGTLFSHKRSLWRHKKIHKNNDMWTCQVCLQKFSRKDTLIRHEKHHDSTQNGKCPFCDKVFSRTDSIQRHISINHSDEVLNANLYSQ